MRDLIGEMRAGIPIMFLQNIGIRREFMKRDRDRDHVSANRHYLKDTTV